jgi:hypothetical protein
VKYASYAVKPMGMAGSGARWCVHVSPSTAGFAAHDVRQHSLVTNGGIGRPTGQGGVPTG